MSAEAYLNHPTFGLLYRVCALGEGQELFMTLYAHRLFFRVLIHPEGMEFEPMSRAQARMLVDMQLRTLRRTGKLGEYEHLQLFDKQMFS
ncbi:MAG: PipX family protein [Gloeomargaritaceae cyanobacterium C42_A2020_066]|nr:PipX family protein [Gloeomargaritaceae cyanobacterium C42_A2020_066]